MSPKKVAPVLDLVRGRNLYDAKVILALDRTKASKMVLKVVKSAEANSKGKANIDNLVVSNIWVSPGPTVRSGRPSARLHFSPLIKRTSHIYVGLTERSSK
ncbi:hypothetical protein A3K42_00495 [candidate division WWE3 bacterium RBG_13_37_7]|uniref:50S ribosomal protein L22 n=1 Tax=candidate division WWE3 bacterium RBG_13_37_7 TaxID=1802609 RepID=A0A1F4U035_UNCKA|nr:MAG: hypothetical protein A3K42_00495 [candidate division WWE3 bacterium RBG_13_37_7]